MKKIWVAVLIVGISVLTAVGCNYSDVANPKIPQIVREARSSIVFIEVIKYDKGKEPKGWATGFFVRENIIVTAYHVVKDESKVKVYFDNGEFENPELLYIDFGNDLVLLRVSKNKGKPLPVASLIKPGEDAWFCGFNPFLRYKITHYNVLMKLKEEDIYLGEYANDGLLLDNIFEQGNSGGPIFNHEGEVIGMVVGYVDYGNPQNNIGIVINSDAIIKALKSIK